MMDPKRLLELSDGDGASALERELLTSLQPPSSARREVWQRLAAPGVLLLGASAAGVTAAAAKASASTGAVATGSSILTSAKLGILMAVAAPVAAGAIYVAKSSSPEPAPSAAPAAVVAPAQTSEPRADVQPELQPAEPQVERPPSTEKAADKAQQSAISEENRLLREARAASRAGDAAGALATLKQLDKRFPGGALVQERELLRVQALRAQGSHAEAEQRARRFLRLYPTSPYASHMKASLENKAP